MSKHYWERFQPVSSSFPLRSMSSNLLQSGMFWLGFCLLCLFSICTDKSHVLVLPPFLPRQTKKKYSNFLQDLFTQKVQIFQ